MSAPLAIERYRLETLLSTNRWAEVFRAHDTAHDRVVMLTLLPADVSADEEYRRRFGRAATLAAQLTDPHVIPSHGFGEIDGRLYLDSRLVAGDPLHQVIGKRLFNLEEALDLAEQLAGAIDAAHRCGLAHGDISPAEVLLSRPDRPGRPPYIHLIGLGVPRDGDRRADVRALARLIEECVHSPLSAAVQDVLAGAASDRYPRASELVAALRAVAGEQAGGPRTLVLDDDGLAGRSRSSRAPRWAWAAGAVVTVVTLAAVAALLGARGAPDAPATAVGPPVDPAVIATIPVAAAPGALVATADRIYVASSEGRAVVANGALTVIDAGILSPVAVTPIPSAGGVVVTADGRSAYVSGANVISVIDTATNAVTGIVGVTGSSLAISPDGRMLHLLGTVGAQTSILRVDLLNRQVVSSTPVPYTAAFAMAPDGRQLYAAQTRATLPPADEQTVIVPVAVIDVTTGMETRRISLGEMPGCTPRCFVLPNGGLAIAPDGKKLYLLTESGLTSVDIASSIASEPAYSISGSEILIAPDGRRAFVSSPGYSPAGPPPGRLLVVDLASVAVTKEVMVGVSPSGLALSPDGTRLYVANSGSDTITVLDVAAL